MAVQYDSEKGLITWLDLLEKQAPEISTQIKELLDLFNDNSLHGLNNSELKEFFDGLDGADEDFLKFIDTVDTSENVFSQYQQYLIKSGKSTSIFTSFTQKAGTAIKSLGAAMASMAVNWVISKAIEIIATGIDKVVHATEYAKKAFKEAADSAKSFSDAIKNIQKDTVNMESSVNSIIDRYAELSQGVNSFTNENESLSTDKYEEFLNLNKQLAGLFPSLTRNYDDNGNAILGLSGSVDSVTESIRALVEQEKDLAKNNIRENLEGYFNGTKDAKGAWKALEGKKKSVEEINEELNSLTDTYNALMNSDKKETFIYEHGKEYVDYIQNNFGIDISSAVSKSTTGMSVGIFGSIPTLSVDFSKLELTEKQKAEITKSYDTFYSELLAKQKTAMSEFNSQNSDISNNALFWLEDLDFYKDSNIYVQTAIQNLVRSIDWSNYDPEQLDYEGVKRILQDSILTPFQVACDDPTVKKSLEDALVGLYTLNLSDMSVNDIDSKIRSYVETITAILHKTPAELKINIDFKEIDDIKANLNNRVLDLLDDKYVLMGHFGERFISTAANESEEYASWLKATENLTVEQAKLFLETIDGAESIAQALEMWNTKLAELEEAGKQSFSAVLTNSTDSIDKFQSSVKSAADAYTTLLTGNYSSSELLDSIQAINKAASDMGKSIDWEAIATSDNPLQAIQDQIEAISNTYTKSVLSGTGIGTDSKFGQMLANIVQEAYKSEAALSSLNTQIDSLQNAYNDLTDIVATYNKTGYITFDQLQTLLAMEPQYIACLMDESGQLQLNQESMLALANQRLDEAEAQAVQQAITELGQLALQDEKTAVEENAAAFSSAVNDLAVYNEELANTIGEASVASSVIRDLNAAISGAESQGATDTEIDTVLNNLGTKLQLIKTTRIGLNKSLGNIMGGGSGSLSKSDFSETIDFFEHRVEVLDDALSHLKSTMDNISGSSAKNNLVDAELGITGEKFKNYTDALAMYTKKANEAFSKIPADIASKVKDGAVTLTDFIGDGNKDVVEAIKDYESWTDKISDCKQELAELQKEIRQFELEKFNNIMKDFQNQFDLRGDSKDLLSKQIDLLKAAGELIGESFFTAQIDQSKKQLELLEAEKAQLVNQMSSAINSGRIQKGTEEWMSMVNALSDVDSSILDCKKSIEEFDNSILELHTEIFNRIQDQFSNLDSEISNILDLFEEFEVSDEKGIWSKEGIAQLGLLSQQYELAQYQIQQYNDEIDELNKHYLAGKYSATEYADKLADLNDKQWDAVKASESAKDALMDLNEKRIENQIKGIEKEIDAYKELTDAQIEALKASKDLHDYEKSIAEKTKSITDLERQIAAMQNDNSAATVAKRKKLEEQLAEAKKDLEESEYEHSVEVQEDTLNKQYEAYEKERNDEIDALRESLNDKETIIAESFNTVKKNAATVGQEIATIATQHGITVSKTLISSWQSGEKAIASYGAVLSQNTSAFIGNIMDVENEVWNLQAQANTTADSLAWMFSTKADNLVNELTTSYYAESNLAYMTQALQNSLINTLERGYNVNSIVNSLNSIEGAADRAKTAIDRLNSYRSELEDKNLDDLYVDDVGSNPLRNYFKAYPGEYLIETGKVHTGDLTSMLSSAFENVGNLMKLKKYASGTRSSKGAIFISDENGYEMKLPKLANGQYTIANEGTQVLTKTQTDNIFEWAKFNPEDFVPVNMTAFMDNLRASTMPTIQPNNVNNSSVNVHYDSMINVHGSINNTDVKQMEAIANKAVDRMVDKINDGITYGR